MSIQKKSLISTLKTAKKANVASASTHEVDAKGGKVASMRQGSFMKVGTMKVGSLRTMKATSQRSYKK